MAFANGNKCRGFSYFKNNLFHLHSSLSKFECKEIIGIMFNHIWIVHNVMMPVHILVQLQVFSTFFCQYKGTILVDLSSSLPKVTVKRVHIVFI